jgi:hypothetical protein
MFVMMKEVLITKITGRLKSGKLHGLVVVEGTLSNDPNSEHCTNTMFDGLGFVGQFENGTPTGVCWKELHGGSWIYGEVNTEGQFSGIYPGHPIFRARNYHY